MRLLNTRIYVCLILCILPQLLHAVKFEEYILAPASREVKPQTVFLVNGTITGAESLLESNGSADHPTTGLSISGANSHVTYDFGKNIGGRVQFTINNASGSGEILGLTYAESSTWVSPMQSDAVGHGIADVPFNFTISQPGNYTVPQEFLRGAFKYLTVTLHTPGTIEITSLQVNYTAMPHWEDMRAYTGYFHSNDELLNRIWYAGAYTNQICTISPSEGDSLTQIGIVPPGQNASVDGITFLNTTITNGTSAVVDGARRDRLVWPGDYAVAVPAIAVSTYDIISVKNGIDSVFAEQTSAGQLPYAGFPMTLPPATFSFTYHLYSLIDVANVFTWTGDTEWLQGKWDGWKRAMAWSLGTIDETGLMNVTSPQDWLRFNLGAHAIEPNAILYGTLGLGLSLATVVNDTSVVEDYTNNMTTIKAAANAILWNGDAGMYRDNETSTLLPQDGNAWAIRSGKDPVPQLYSTYYGLMNSSQALSISKGLQARWTAFGATAVEAGNATSPFISSFELDAHMTVNNADASLELMRRQWGFMLNDPRMTNSTFIEGYSADGTLHYPPYPNDAVISYAHGWATGPTFTLSAYVAGIRIMSQAGKTWTIWPQPGNLTNVEAGLSTTVGNFSVAWNISDTTLSLQFSTPRGTSGSVVIPTLKDQNKNIVSHTIERVDNDKTVKVSNKWQDELFLGQDGLEGGEYRVTAQYSI